MNARYLSIVIPVYNSERTIGELVEQLEKYFQNLYKIEIVLVNDGSPDHSIDVLYKMAQRFPNVKVVNLSKNFGQHNAIIAGFHYVAGDYVITMDDDLQHSVDELIKLVMKIEEGYDVVYGQYLQKNHTLFQNLGSELNNTMANVIIKKPKYLRFTSLRIIRSFVVKELIKYEAPYPYIDGLLLRVTSKIGTVEIHHKERKVGKSNYTLKKLFNLWLNGFLNFSIVPLRVFSYFGMLCAGIGFIAAMVIFIRALFFYSPVEGWASLIVSILILSGVQMLSIGMVGEYVGRVFLTQNNTPQYVIREVINTDQYSSEIFVEQKIGILIPQKERAPKK